MTQTTYTLSKEKWQNIIVQENNDPIVLIPQTSKIRLANPNIKIRKQLIQMLEKATDNLPDNLCLYIVEGIRSMEKQKQQWDLCYENMKTKFPDEDVDFWEKQTGLLVAKPSPLANHNCGGAIDLQLVYKDSDELVDMGTPIQSNSDYILTKMLSEDITEIQKQNRKILRDVMEEAGFVWYPGEWWHYCYGDRMWAVYTGKGECFYGPVDMIQ
jgi:zinc D-Ala-D-Ala dipeptidase